MVENLMTTKDFRNDPMEPGTQAPQQQLAFDGMTDSGDESAAAGGPGPVNSAATARCLFVPTNREDVLLQLSSLAFSRNYPAGLTVVAVQDDALALLPDGLRVEEASLLQNGRPGRFPVLVELREPASVERGAFGIAEIGALCFRNQADADDFRFRPVDEFDTEALPCRVDPALFDLPGAARFRNSPQEVPELQNCAAFSDRVAGGVCSVLELGATEPACWQEIANLLSSGCVGASSHEVTLARALAWKRLPASEGAQVDAVLGAFMTHEAGDSSSSLVARIHSDLHFGNENAGQLRIAERWFAMANAVLQNRARLDGQLLSDEKSVALRAALLASVVDEVRALIPFMHAPSPAGRKVVVTAAFLIGLRSGITDMPWAMKRIHLNVLSPLIVALREGGAETRERVGQAFQFEPDETAPDVVLRLFWNDHEIACWQPQRMEAPLPASGADGDAFSVTEPRPDPIASADASGERATDGPENDAPTSILAADGRSIELLPPEPPRQRGVTMRYVLSGTERLCKPKEILVIACTGGLLWRAGVSADGAEALYADLLQWPDDVLLAETSGALGPALGAYLAKKKTRASAGSSRSGKTAGKTAGKKAGEEAVEPASANPV